ncbi:RadC-like JAB domain protein [uncultured archaeon]|nr:RadC-like JAB domain protein [uncultured archaeon]
MKIKSLPTNERPREKLIKYGPGKLTESELLAIILRIGSKKESVIELANKLFTKYNVKTLSRLNLSTLKKEFGIGEVKACEILACFELGRRLSAFKEDKKPIISNAKDLVKIILPEMSSLEKEHFKGIYLDSRMRIVKQENIFIGSLNESVVHPRDIFKIALEENAAALILVHNHPSGDPSPSNFDTKVTKEIAKSGRMLGIPVLDHVIIGGKTYFSFKEKGLI